MIESMLFQIEKRSNVRKKCYRKSSRIFITPCVVGFRVYLCTIGRQWPMHFALLVFSFILIIYICLKHPPIYSIMVVWKFTYIQYLERFMDWPSLTLSSQKHPFTVVHDRQLSPTIPPIKQPRRAKLSTTFMLKTRLRLENFKTFNYTTFKILSLSECDL